VGPETLFDRLFRFGRALVVGGGATLTDISIFTACVRALGVAPAIARVPALLAGACFQFFGNRSFTFRAAAGSLTRQAKLFLAFEAVALVLNWATFRVLLEYLTFLPAELVTFVASFLVFVGFAYPMRRHVIFKLPR
jgi:putative flippase GtrA